MISPETKAKLHELIKGTNLTESMIETAYENGALEGEEWGMTKGIAKGQLDQIRTTVLESHENGIDIKLIAKITKRTVDEVKSF